MKKIIWLTIVVASLGAVPAWALATVAVPSAAVSSSNALAQVLGQTQDSTAGSTQTSVQNPSQPQTQSQSQSGSSAFSCAQNPSQCINTSLTIGPHGVSPYYQGPPAVSYPQGTDGTVTYFPVGQDTSYLTTMPADINDKPSTYYQYSYMGAGGTVYNANPALGGYVANFDMNSVAAGVSQWQAQWGSSSDWSAYSQNSGDSGDSVSAQ